MRLFLSVVATGLLILEQCTLIASFSIPTARRTTTTLALSETLTNPHSNHDNTAFLKEKDDLQQILSLLEKRMKEGPGSLSPQELEAFQMGSDRLLLEMKQKAQAPAVETILTPPLDVVVEVAPPPTTTTTASMEDLHLAVSELDARKVSTLLQSGLELDEATTDAAFWTVVQAVDRAEALDQPLPETIPQMLHHIFEADHRHLLNREKQTTNVTCMQPAQEENVEGAARRMNYIFDDMAHRHLPLSPGRLCEGGNCCDKCSSNIFPTFATDRETSFELFPEIQQFTFNHLQNTTAATILQFTRLIERVRRTIAHEYGLPLKTILPLQAYSRKYVAGATQQGGGGGEGDFVILHTDESTHPGYHYSCVLYLSTQGIHFEGGDFVFNDPAKIDADQKTEDNIDEDEFETLGALEEQIRRAGRELTPFHPKKGAAVIFSSGWENMHEVEKITSGIRYAVPCFFTTCPVPEAAYQQMVVGKPKTDEDIADDWLHLLLAHRNESPMESAGRVKELMMKWHYMCAPLSEH